MQIFLNINNKSKFEEYANNIIWLFDFMNISMFVHIIAITVLSLPTCSSERFKETLILYVVLTKKIFKKN